MFKLRVVGPRSRDAPYNGSHMEYIGQRAGAERNAGMNHGLFGEVNGQKCEKTESIKDMSAYANRMTKSGAIMYKAIISLTEADGIRLGYDKSQKWRELIQAKIPDICRKIGLSPSALEYAAAVHLEQNHPHCHILFWDKEQKVKKQPYVHWKIANDIRIDLTKYVFADEMDVIKTAKNMARNATYKELSDFFTDFIDNFANMTAKEYGEAVERLKLNEDFSHGKLIYNRFKAADMREIAQDFLKLRNNIPRDGRLDFKFMLPKTKSEIIDFIKMILSKNEDCRREYTNYANAAEELSEFYSDKPERHAEARKNAEDDMMKRLGNVVLKAVKNFNKLEQEKDYQHKQDIYKRQTAENLITEIFSVLSRVCQTEDNKLSYASHISELSKQAKKERAIMYENTSGYDWES